MPWDFILTCMHMLSIYMRMPVNGYGKTESLLPSTRPSIVCAGFNSRISFQLEHQVLVMVEHICHRVRSFHRAWEVGEDDALCIYAFIVECFFYALCKLS